MHPAIRKNGVAVITGGAMGIGYAVAHRLAQEGMQLVLLDRNATALMAATDRLQATFPTLIQRSVVGDVTDHATIEQVYQEAVELGEIALLVNNAAIIKGAGPWENAEQWHRIMDINFWAILALQQRFVPTLIEQTSASAIVNLGSKEGITTPPGNAAYSVSKAAVRVLTEQLAHELCERVQDRVTAHLLIPGWTFTPMNFPDVSADAPQPTGTWSADQVVDRMVESLSAGDFYIFCQDNDVTREMDQRRMQWSADDMIQNRPALSRWHPDWREKFAEFMKGA
ncbi:SDR family oxidoreductase [Dickeya undicola]|uniref:SDR family oxidoreductase n=1 Tax=Dickeya undicola TaxID=1577887 RepID=A0ABX9WNX4_9GAMM|nr:SDR family oxidoreductase [Dickeya undicola]RNM19083.1 SDR family oxidoreductase [Dickeya undicola]